MEPSSAAKRVYDLLQQLEPREKAHAKRMFSANKRNSKQALLFDRLNRMPLWDGDQIQAFGRKAGMALPSTCQGLYRAILDALRSYHTRSSPTLQLQALLADVEILYSKGLSHQCAPFIDRGILLADQHEEPGYGLLFRHWRFRNRFAGTVSGLAPLHEQGQTAKIALLAREFEATLTTASLASLLDSTFEATGMPYAEATALLESRILAHPMIQNRQSPTFQAGRYAYLDLIASVYFYLEQWKTCREYLDEIHAFLQELEQTGSAPQLYRIGMVLCNLMAVANHQADRAAFRGSAEHFVALLERAREDSDENEQQLVERYCVPRFRLQQARHAALTGDEQLGRDLLQQFLEPYAERADSAAGRMEMDLEIAAIQFRFGRFEPALALTQSLQANKELRHDKERTYAVGWIALLSAYGMQDESLFESRWRSFRERLRHGAGRHWPLEQRLLLALRKSLFSASAERVRLLAPVYDAFAAAGDVVTKPARYFDLMGWLGDQAALPGRR